MIHCGKYKFAVIKCGFIGQDMRQYLLYSIVEYLTIYSGRTTKWNQTSDVCGSI